MEIVIVILHTEVTHPTLRVQIVTKRATCTSTWMEKQGDENSVVKSGEVSHYNKCEIKENKHYNGKLGESPFTQKVLEAPISNKFKPPTMKSYNSLTDLKDYIEVFEGLMDFQAAYDAIKCWAFQIAFTRNARLWYRKMLGWLVSTITEDIHQLVLLTHTNKKTTTNLATIRQKENKTLKEYMNQFQEELLKVMNYLNDLAMFYFLTGLNDDALTIRLGKESLVLFADFLKKQIR